MDLLHLAVKFDTLFVDLNSVREIMSTNNEKCSVKMSGYLEKKGKMMMSSWKNHWFVLEGHLLLYYRSKAEYDALGPCKGSVSLGPSCTVKPLLGTACVFQIETRSNTIVLKAKTRLEQEKWMQAILAALNQHPNATNGMLHFRYSSDDLIPRRTGENKIPLSRQYTLPERSKIEKRHTFCRSFDTLQSACETRPKSAVIPNKLQETSKKLSPKQPPCIMIENVEYCSPDDVGILVENTEYAHCENGGNLIVDNAEYCQVPTTEEVLPNMMEQSEEYYGISVPTEAEKEYLRNKAQERSEHIYERISGESKISTCSREAILDNDVYSTAEEIKKFCLKSSENDRQDSVNVDNDIYNERVIASHEDDFLVDNDQYCTPDIVVRDTELVSYHEYNIPDKDRDKHIYSVPNFDNTDLNDNRLSRREHIDVNPYSVCHIYPKSRPKSNLDQDALYDDPQDYAFVPETRTARASNVNKLMRKFKKFTGGHSDNKEHVKKSTFLQKLFKRERKKRDSECESVAESEYAQVDEEVVKKMDIAYCVDKKLLAELEMILQAKKRKLEEYFEETNTISSSSTEEPKTDGAAKQQRITDAVIKPKVPSKPQKGKGTKVNYENLQTIDEILNNLEQMKRNNTLTGSNVQSLINKFDHTVKMCSPTSKEAEESFSGIVELRPKEENIAPKSKNHNNTRCNSNDELTRLLNELAKVTNAPILTPGATSSLGVTSKLLDEEFKNLLPKKERRLSEPDYDIPRPHTNLPLTKKDEDREAALTATRFFGPAMPNYEKSVNFSPPLTSMSPDSLETSILTTNSVDGDTASYTSHIFQNINRPIQKQKRSKEDPREIFIDSLEQGD